MTDGNKKSEKRRRGRGIQRSGAIRSLSFFFCVSFVFPVEFLIYRIVTTESEGNWLQTGTAGRKSTGTIPIFF